MKGEVRRTINRVYGPWGGGSPRKGSAVVFPHDSSEPVMDEMQGRGAHGGCRMTPWRRRKAKGKKSLGLVVADTF
jgi:hypothetical protein